MQAFQLASTNAKVNGWILSLQEFDYEIFHIVGTMNVVADSLSRVPWELLMRMEQEELRALMHYHQNEIQLANGMIGGIRILKREENLKAFAVDEKGLGRLELRNWASWHEALLRFMARGSFHTNLTKGKRRRIQTMAAQFRLEEMEKEGKRTLRLLYHNRHEQYIPVPRNHDEIIQIMQHYLDQPCAGHYAAEMTFRRVYRSYY